MDKKEFMKLKAGDVVKVKPLEAFEGELSEVAKGYCGKKFRVHTLNEDTALLEWPDGKVIGQLFSHDVLEFTDEPDAAPEAPETWERKSAGYLKHFALDQRLGKIGEPTSMTDYDGHPLFVGDVVNVTPILPKEVQALTKGIVYALGKMLKDNDCDDGLPVDKLFKQATEVHVSPVVDMDGDRFVLGLAKEYNERTQDVEKWKVTKIVDFSAVADGAIIKEILYRT